MEITAILFLISVIIATLTIIKLNKIIYDQSKEICEANEANCELRFDAEADYELIKKLRREVKEIKLATEMDDMDYPMIIVNRVTTILEENENINY